MSGRPYQPHARGWTLRPGGDYRNCRDGAEALVWLTLGHFPPLDTRAIGLIGGINAEALDRAVPALAGGEAIAALGRLSDRGLLLFSPEHGSVFVPDFARGQPVSWSRKNAAGLLAALRDLVSASAFPREWTARIIVAHAEAMAANGDNGEARALLIDAPSMPLRCPIEPPSMPHRTPSDGPSMQQKQKQKQKNCVCTEPSALVPPELGTVLFLAKGREPATLAALLSSKRLEALSAALSGEAFKRIAVGEELALAGAWSLANPSKAKTVSGLPRFIVAWLARAEPKPTAAPVNKPYRPECENLLEKVARS